MMNRIKSIFSTTLFLLISLLSFAQAPQRFSYQAVIYDAQNNLVINKTVGAKISICAVDPNSSPIYVETQTPTTNDNGLATMQIGTGTVVPGNKRIPFANINWATGDYYIRVKVDPLGGTNYELITVTTRINSVPYALYSQTTGTAGVKGAAGAKGVDGQNGADGTNGTNGSDGKTILNGTINPTSSVGHDGDFYLNTASQTFFGPKANNTWNNGILLSGNTILNGSIDPISAIGKDGDFYVNTSTKTLFGPRKNTAWSITAGDFPKGQNAGDIYYWNGTAWTILSKGTDGKQLMVINGKPTWGPLLATVSMTYSSVSKTKFTLNGNITSDGGSTVTARGFCWSTSNSPDAFGDTIYCGTGTGTFSATFNLKGSIAYVRAFAINSGDQGIAYSSMQTLTLPFYVGDVGPSGGFVFYDKGVFSDGWRYLECPAFNNIINVQLPWGNDGTVATDTIIGSGKQNTSNIISTVRYTLGETYAAKYCDDFTQNGYDDWFLPSYLEMKSLGNYLTSVNHGVEGCWTSSSDATYPAYDGQLAYIYPSIFNSDFERQLKEYRTSRYWYWAAVPIRSF